MVVVGIDPGRELVRSTFPHIVPEHRGVFVLPLPLRHGDRPGRVAAVPVRDQEAAKPLSVQRVEDLTERRAVRLQPQRRAAGKGREPLCQTVRKHRQDGNPQWLGCFHGQPFRDDVVGLE